MALSSYFRKEELLSRSVLHSRGYHLSKGKQQLTPTLGSVSMQILAWHKLLFFLLIASVAVLLPPLLWFGVRLSPAIATTSDLLVFLRRPAASGPESTVTCLSPSWRHAATAINSEALNSTDARVHATFVAANVSDARQLERLPPDKRAELERQLGINFGVAERVFKLYDNYLRAYNLCYFRLLRDPGPCGTVTDHTAVIVVSSLPASADRRMAVRERLLSLRLAGVRSLFIMGRTGEAAAEAAVAREADAFGDIIWADFWEDYNNLTIKTLTMLRWVEQNCPLTRYLVKADDDVFLSSNNLVRLLTSSANSSRAIIGTFSYDEGPFRNIGYKWYMPFYMYNKTAYPPFAHGPCYIITIDLLKDLNAKALSVNYVHLEDIFIALCADLIGNVSLVNVPRFIAHACSVHEAVAFHRVTCP